MAVVWLSDEEAHQLDSDLERVLLFLRLLRAYISITGARDIIYLAQLANAGKITAADLHEPIRAAMEMDLVFRQKEVGQCPE